MREIIPRNPVIEVGADEVKPLKAATAPSPGDAEDYAHFLSPLIESLRTDIKSGSMLWLDPDEISDIGKEVMDPEEIKKMQALKKSKTPAQVKAELAFGDDWIVFYFRWKADLKTVESFSGTLPGSAPWWIVGRQRWNLIERDDLDFQRFRARYITLGFKPTHDLPEPEKPIIKVPGVEDIKAAGSALKSVAMVGAVAVGAFVAFKIFGGMGASRSYPMQTPVRGLEEARARMREREK